MSLNQYYFKHKINFNYTIDIYLDDNVEFKIKKFYNDKNLIFNEELIIIIKKFINSIDLLDYKYITNLGIRFFDFLNLINKEPFLYLIQIWRC